MKRINLLCGVMLGISSWLFTAPPVEAQGGTKATLSVEKIHAKQTLQADMERAGKGSSLGRVTEAFDTQLTHWLSESGKFRVSAVSDLAVLLKAGNRAGQASESTELKYGLVATLDDFEDSTERMLFKKLNQVGIKRKIRFSVVAKIWNISSNELWATASILVSTNDDYSESMELQKNSEQTDALLLVAVRKAAQQVADRVADVAFPVKVIAIGNPITINRGDNAGVYIGQDWNVYSVGNMLTDPDTGELLGREEVKVGTARIVETTPKFSKAEFIGDSDNVKVSTGMVLRRPQQLK